LLTYHLDVAPTSKPPTDQNVDEAMNLVFKALNDPSRRLLLDRLRRNDGQSLGELCAHLPWMTRYGVMNHIRVLADSHLITTVAAGRRKHHHLNPEPIRLIRDRWIGNFVAPMDTGLASPARTEVARLHTDKDSVSVPSHRYQTFVRCRPVEAWAAITEGDSTVRYFYGARVESTWMPGETVRYLGQDESVVADGNVVAVNAPSRLEMTFHPRWDPALEIEGAAHMAWIAEETDGLTRITVEYYDLAPGSRQATDFMAGIPLIVAGLKTLLETGQPMAPAAP